MPNKKPDTTLLPTPDVDPSIKGLGNLAKATGALALLTAVAGGSGEKPNAPDPFVESGTNTIVVDNTRVKVSHLPQAGLGKAYRDAISKTCSRVQSAGGGNEAPEGTEAPEESKLIIEASAEDVERYSNPMTTAEAERLFGAEGVFNDSLKNPEICQMLADLDAMDPKSMDDLGRIAQELASNAEFQQMLHPFNVDNPKTGDAEAVKAQVEFAQNLSEFLAPLMAEEVGDSGIVMPANNIVMPGDFDMSLIQPQIMTAGNSWPEKAGQKLVNLLERLVKWILGEGEKTAEELRDIFGKNLKNIGLYTLSPVGKDTADWTRSLPGGLFIALGMLGLLRSAKGIKALKITGMGATLGLAGGIIGASTIDIWGELSLIWKTLIIAGAIGGSVAFYKNGKSIRKEFKEKREATMKRAKEVIAKQTKEDITALAVLGAAIVSMMANAPMITGEKQLTPDGNIEPIDLLFLIRHIPMGILIALGAKEVPSFIRDVGTWHADRGKRKQEKKTAKINKNRVAKGLPELVEVTKASLRTMPFDDLEKVVDQERLCIDRRMDGIDMDDYDPDVPDDVKNLRIKIAELMNIPLAGRRVAQQRLAEAERKRLAEEAAATVAEGPAFGRGGGPLELDFGDRPEDGTGEAGDIWRNSPRMNTRRGGGSADDGTEFE